MNKLLALLAAMLPLAAAAASAPVVTIANAGNVIVDGVNYGAPVDALANNPALASPIQTALTAFVAAKVAETQAAIATANTARDQAIASANTARDAAIAANADALSAKTARVAALEAHLAQLATYIAGLRGTIIGLGGTSQPPPTAP